jgi:hypothetical protein
LLARGNGFPPEFGWLALIGFLTGYMADFAWCAWAVNRLSEDFRVRAAERFEPRTVVRARLPLKARSNWSFTPTK